MPDQEPTDPVDVSEHVAYRDAAYWAKAVTTLEVGELPARAVNLNVQGRRVAGPVQGFGKMWQKTYRVRIPHARITPEELIRVWRARFPSFWPKGNLFYGPLTELSPGDVAVLNLKAVGPMKLSTGIFVLYADETSFTFMTPEGHQWSAWITFSAYAEDHNVVAQVQPLLRASDPIFEMGAWIMRRMEDAFWQRTLGNLAAHFGARDAEVTVETLCVDKKRQWRMAKNVRHNSLIRTIVYLSETPFRLMRRRLQSFRRNPGREVG